MKHKLGVIKGQWRMKEYFQFHLTGAILATKSLSVGGFTVPLQTVALLYTHIQHSPVPEIKSRKDMRPQTFCFQKEARQLRACSWHNIVAMEPAVLTAVRG